ncbi:hypothetical protein [Stratiformator vulcanicus]|uniref:Uncharacterized protein n=1 Tax=Stratiformator vulcanicus TaxID=2527980 RepID=A0A517R5Z9_9PLAN|nr:hypothetical protein [Stratiformator vulcanicus]QDT39326.1 hypothetical protein Pan189_37320 [Stratiformator vulcanicus]
MRQIEIELSIGDVVRVGDQNVTVIDIDDSGEVTFRIDPAHEVNESEQLPSRPRAESIAR